MPEVSEVPEVPEVPSVTNISHAQNNRRISRFLLLLFGRKPELPVNISLQPETQCVNLSVSTMFALACLLYEGALLRCEENGDTKRGKGENTVSRDEDRLALIVQIV